MIGLIGNAESEDVWTATKLALVVCGAIVGLDETAAEGLDGACFVAIDVGASISIEVEVEVSIKAVVMALAGATHDGRSLHDQSPRSGNSGRRTSVSAQVNSKTAE